MATKIEKKLAYLQETKDAIKSALIEKGQTVSDTDTFRSYAEKILAIQGGGATVVEIIPEQELTFTLDEANSIYALSGYNLFNLTSMTVGETYDVVWGTEEYSCTALEVEFMGQPMIAIGNPVMAGGENNNMPFAIGYVTIPDDGDSQYICIIASLDGSASKRVRIYQEVGSGATETDVIPEQEFTLTLNSQLNVYMASGYDMFSIESGQEYNVVWGEETFTCTAFDGVFESAPCVAIGNPYPVGGESNELPFIIGCVPNLEGHTLCLIVALVEQTATKKVRVYQKASEGNPSEEWQTILEEQTASASYDTITLTNLIRIPTEYNVGFKQNYHGFFKVWFDGVVYLCNPFRYDYELSKEVLGITKTYSTLIGNPTVLKGRMLTSMTYTGKETFSEPFAIDVTNDSAINMYVNDTNPHTLRVDFMPRGRM